MVGLYESRYSPLMNWMVMDDFPTAPVPSMTNFISSRSESSMVDEEAMMMMLLSMLIVRFVWKFFLVVLKMFSWLISDSPVHSSKFETYF